jgi:hypothetical protein
MDVRLSDKLAVSNAVVNIGWDCTLCTLDLKM